jgi:hypothetical protein
MARFFAQRLDTGGERIDLAVQRVHRAGDAVEILGPVRLPRRGQLPADLVEMRPDSTELGGLAGQLGSALPLAPAGGADRSGPEDQGHDDPHRFGDPRWLRQRYDQGEQRDRGDRRGR